jgi:hypothetical protein
MGTNVVRPKNDTRHTRTDCTFEIACIAGNSEVAAFDAAKHIRFHIDARMFAPLTRILEHGRRAMNRAAAAYALAEVSDARVIAMLERTVANKLEDPKVRGYAAEALAHQHRQESHRVLLNNITDGCEEVRFWCAFAIGEMTGMDTLPLLESLSRKDAKRGPRSLHRAHTGTGVIGGIQQKLGSTCQFCIAS